MSEEESPDLTKSWVFLDPEKKPPETSRVEDVEDVNEPHADSDTDSISVISESGCSYKTDEDDFVPTTTLESEEPPEDKPESEAENEPPEAEDKSPEPEVTEIARQETKIPEPFKSNPLNDKAGIEKILYFATSAACAVILIGFSVAIQQYFYESSDVNSFNADFSSSPHYVQTVKTRDIQIDDNSKRLYLKKRSQSRFEEPQKKIMKLESDNNFHDKIVRPNIRIKNNDLRVEDVKSNYKPNKNKSPAAKFNKENRDDTDKRVENDKYRTKNKRNNANDKIKSEDENRPKDEHWNKKMKELRVKENYLRQKEKYLLEKEHDLMKKEIKLNQENLNYGKNKYYKADKKRKQSEEDDDDDDDDSRERKEMKKEFKKHKKYNNENNNPKNNKKYKNKEEKKQKYIQKQPKVVDNEPHKKRNISGQWYINLHKARNNIRQKEHASDWVFDRAHLRSLKRNKAHWYFQWMVDRARLRVK